MVSTVVIDRETGNGKYSDLIDVAEYLGHTDKGSAVNALNVMARQSSLFEETKSSSDFRQWLAKRRKQGAN